MTTRNGAHRARTAGDAGTAGTGSVEWIDRGLLLRVYIHERHLVQLNVM